MTQQQHVRTRSPRLRRRALAVGATLAVAAATAATVATTTAAPAEAATYGTISAHRGGGWGPDNSLKAFKGALAANIDDIEGDVYFTTDDVAVFRHDNSLSACGLNRTITGSSWAQIDQVRCSGEPLARLTDVAAAFRASPNTNAVLRVELKHPASQTAAAAQAHARLLVSRLVDRGIAGRSIIQDFDWRTTAATIHAARSTMRVSCLESSVTDAEVATADSKGCYDLSYNYANWRDGLNATIHGKGMKVAVWTVNSASTFTRFRDDLHANVIITDYPGAAKGW